ncbi:MAG: hypothetical protein FJ128_13630 [Deltaproteobacteria bacterium]|nr:hypothetical protein [Deltaproteobacteria bacterium]
MNEEEYRVWKGNIVADYRLEGVCIFLGLGLLLHLQAGGPAALATPGALLYFAAGFLISYLLVGEINFQIIITQARLRAPAYRQMSIGDKAAEVSRGRRIVRFLQMLVCLLVPWGLYRLLAVWKF